MACDSISPQLFRMSIDGWMLATRTHPACTIHEDGMRFPQWLGLIKKQTKNKRWHTQKSPQITGEPQRYSRGTQKKKGRWWFGTGKRLVGWLVGWLPNVPATCKCISGTDLFRQIYVLPHRQKLQIKRSISPSTDPITPGAWQGSHWSVNFEVTGMTRPRKKSRRMRDSTPRSSALEADALTTRWSYLRDGSAQTSLRAATLRLKLQIKLATSPYHSLLTPSQPVPAPTL